MFYNCESLKYLNLSNFEAPGITERNKMFKNCKDLTSIRFIKF